MAINVQATGGKSVSIIGVLIAIVVVGTLVAGAYFFFFNSPELIDVVLPPSLRGVDEISEISFEPERVLTSEKFGVLVKYGSDIVVPSAGKSNPFLP